MKHELTITLKPFCYVKTARQQFEMTKPMMLSLLKPYKHTTVCELTESNNIHYHTLIEIEGNIARDMLINRIRPYKAFGKYTCRAVQWEQSYEDYLMKSIRNTTSILSYDPILKDDYGLRKEPTILTGESPVGYYRQPLDIKVVTTPIIDDELVEMGMDTKIMVTDNCMTLKKDYLEYLISQDFSSL